ncbi:DUF885 family protein [Sphingomonas sp. ASY06-1R]|uniref:DUF885 family protein n=1 Tax=Sphingomonas sp. ASY06-1R TaxID=3445771 RepID=UPI003FA1D0F4
MRWGITTVGLAGLLCATALVTPLAAAPAPAAPAADMLPPPALVSLFTDWRAFAAPERRAGVVDFSPAALARKRDGLVRMRQRLAALDRTGWSPHVIADARLIEAEMNGLDFDLRVRQPWARDPSYYATVIGEESDVPAHEGPLADVIDLFTYRWPLSRGDARALTARLAGVPVLLDRARLSLADSQAADLWRYGGRAFAEQEAVLTALIDGTLSMRTLEGQQKASLAGAPAELRRAAIAARDATAAFGRWVKETAPTKTGPSGVGKANYDWYMKNVQLVPFTWDDQVALLKRELDRAWASLKLEEQHNAALPPIAPIDDPAGYQAYSAAKMKSFTDFIIASGFVPDRPYYRAALAAQTVGYIPPAKRNFFYHVTALDPRPLYSHDIHWVELARIKNEPNPDPIRRGAPLFNIFQSRSEGFATAFEELVMHAGLYDDVPRARELVWIMLANRAARGLASLYVQSNEWSLAQAGHFHARWTPRGWSDASSDLVGFEQLLYLRQPGYGTSYVTGKMELDRLIADAGHADEQDGDAVKRVMAKLAREGTIPFSLYQREESMGKATGRAE